MNKGVLVIIACIFFWACGDGNVRVNVDPTVQLEADSIKIMEYLYMNGYTDDQIGVSNLGVRYVILDSGSMELIDESDFVDFDYIGITLGDTIFDTSILEIGDSLEAHYEENPFLINGDTIPLFTRDDDAYQPFTINYSATGWSIEETLSAEFIIPGFIEGAAVSFRHMSEGGRSLVLIPSGLAYASLGAGVFIGPDEPIMFELRPTKVTKQ